MILGCFDFRRLILCGHMAFLWNTWASNRVAQIVHGKTLSLGEVFGMKHLAWLSPACCVRISDRSPTQGRRSIWSQGAKVDS